MRCTPILGFAIAATFAVACSSSSGGSSGGPDAGTSGSSSGGSSGSSSGSSSGGSSGSSSGVAEGGSGSSSSGSSSGGPSDGGCAPPSGAVAKSCGYGLSGACVAPNAPMAGQLVCNEYYGASDGVSGATQCSMDHGTYYAGMTCAQALPGMVNVGCQQNSGTAACVITYYDCLATCTTCNVQQSPCVEP